MSLIGLLLTLIIIGVVLYLVNTMIPMDDKIKTIINIVVILVILVWLLGVFGVLGNIGTVQVPRVH